MPGILPKMHSLDCAHQLCKSGINFASQALLVFIVQTMKLAQISDQGTLRRQSQEGHLSLSIPHSSIKLLPSSSIPSCFNLPLYWCKGERQREYKSTKLKVTLLVSKNKIKPFFLFFLGGCRGSNLGVHTNEASTSSLSHIFTLIVLIVIRITIPHYYLPESKRGTGRKPGGQC